MLPQPPTMTDGNAAPGRRAVLGSLAAGGAAALGGCGLLDRQPRTTLGGVDVLNYDTVPHDVAVTVERAGDVVHERTCALEARADGVIDAASVPPEWPDDPARFSLSATVRESGANASATVPDHDAPADSALVGVAEDGTLELVFHWQSTPVDE